MTENKTKIAVLIEKEVELRHIHSLLYSLSQTDRECVYYIALGMSLATENQDEQKAS